MDLQSQIEEKLKQFEGGNVFLNKDETTGIAYVFLDHSSKKNAITGKMLVQLSDHLTTIEGWTACKGLIFHSAGDCFTSGMDFTMIGQCLDKASARLLADYMQGVLVRLEQLPIPTVAAVQGKAIGGGAELLTAFDFRVWSPLAEMRFVQAKVGVATGIGGGGTRLTRIVGRASALRFLLSAEVISSEQALQVGLANQVIEDDLLVGTKLFLSRLVANNETIVIRAMKGIVRNSEMSLNESLLAEKEIFVETWRGDRLKTFFGQKNKL